MLGYTYLKYKKNYASAASQLKQAIELGDDDADTWYYLTLSQWQNHDCGFVASAEHYAARCVKDTACQKDQREWASKAALAAVENGMCRAPSKVTNNQAVNAM